MTDNVVLILLAVLVVGLAIWWLVGRSSDAPSQPTEHRIDPRADERPLPPPPAAVGHEPELTRAPLEASPAPVVADPVIASPIVPPLDMPPPAAAPVAADGPADDLLRMKGVGPKLAVQLADLGVTRFAQIAAWTDADLARVDAELGAFKGRPTRDKWIEQARYLAAGDHAGYEAQFGKLGG